LQVAVDEKLHVGVAGDGSRAHTRAGASVRQTARRSAAVALQLHWPIPLTSNEHRFPQNISLKFN
jgi:hypothetical protein